MSFRSAPRATSGFSLIETLVAALIMAVGALGVSGLLLAGLTHNSDALHRTRALSLASDLLERMRANPGVRYAAGLEDPPQAGAPDCRAVDCSPAQLARFDMAGWKCRINSRQDSGATHGVCDDWGIAGVLPGGAGAVRQVGGQPVVTLQWQAAPGLPTVGITLPNVED